MVDRTVRHRLVASSVRGRYDLLRGLGGGLALLGLILSIRAFGGESSERAWHLVHVNWIYFTGLAGGSIAFVAVQKLAKAKWSGLMIRFAEASVAFLPISFVTMLVIFLIGYPHIYGHMQQELHGLSHGKALWLSHGWMFTRLVLGMGVLYLVGWRLVRRDLLPDMFAARAEVTGFRRSLYERWTASWDGSEGAMEQNETRIHSLAALYVVLYALVFTVVAFDGMMALQPHWFSNLFGAWYFMGSFLGAHMLLALMMIYGGKQLDIEGLISPKQRHDLGKLCFGFTVFWTYLMWAQFLVIWYGNLPEETGFVFSRLWGHWRPIGRAVFLGMFLIPFFGLLGVLPKKTRPILGFFAAISLTALWLERYLLIMPSVTAEPGPRFGVPELGPTALFAGLYLLAYTTFARTFPMVSPRLAEITLNRELGHHEVEIFDHEDADPDFVTPSALERRTHPRGGEGHSA